MRLLLRDLVAIALGMLPMSLPAFAADPSAQIQVENEANRVGRLDWPQWGGSLAKNNTPPAINLPVSWNVRTGENIRWTAQIGTNTYGSPVVANGQVYVGTNNFSAKLPRFPKGVDVSVLLCFEEATGEFLWQHTSAKLPTGRAHDWPDQGICSSPFVEGNRLWYVTSRGEVVCLDTEGFRDGENDGPYSNEDNENPDEADIVWRFDMMRQLGSSQLYMANCSVICVGDRIFVNTSNGIDESHTKIPAPGAPSFIALNKHTAEVLWTDASPGRNILDGQWGSPAYAESAGQPQVLFGGGDGWLYSFDPAGDGQGHSRLLWKFDCNPKSAIYGHWRTSERNHIIATPVAYDGLIYVAVGENPERGEGKGHLWCIDPNRRGDVSPTLVVDAAGRLVVDAGDGSRRLQYLQSGEREIANPNSALVWHFSGGDLNGDSEIGFEEEMHRSISTVAIKDDLLYAADFSGAFHCLDAKNGANYWNHDLFAAAWSSPLIADGKVYIADEEGDVTIFAHSSRKQLLAENELGNAVYATPAVANNRLYVTNKSQLFAIGQQ